MAWCNTSDSAQLLLQMHANSSATPHQGCLAAVAARRLRDGSVPLRWGRRPLQLDLWFASVVVGACDPMMHMCAMAGMLLAWRALERQAATTAAI